MNSDDLKNALALSHATSFAPKAYYDLCTQLGSPQQILQASAHQLAECGLNQETIDQIKQPDWSVIDNELEWSQQERQHIITYQHKDYPELMLQTSNPPPILYVRGDTSILSNLQLAIVGSRNPTTMGKQTAYQFANYLGQAGLTITSGMAMGIDTEAHRGALDANAPTIAVMGTGLDRIYPATNKSLAYEIAEQGALVSEFPLGTNAQAKNFPQRNRIMSAMSLGCLVVEAALRSGSLITARFATEQGREVFAIPGSIHNPLAKGCHRLIRDGAKLVETASDIVMELGSLANALTELDNHQQTLTSNVQQSQDSLNEDYALILEKMGYDPITVDHLVDQTDWNVEEISSMLLILELKGLISSNPGGTYTRLN
jgi:DNA processing protein